MTWEEFQQVAQGISEQTGFPLSVLLGQAALETGRGTSYNAKKKNNWFGTGAFDSNPSNAYTFKNPEQSIMYYLQNVGKLVPNWKQYVDDPVKLVQMIKNAGYATDPYYVQKVTSLPEFKRFLSPTSQQGQSPLQNVLKSIITPVNAATQPVSYPSSSASGARSYPSSSASSTNSYIVKAGDTLSGIAKQYLGNANSYNQLSGYRSGNPNLIYPGEKITW